MKKSLYVLLLFTLIIACGTKAEKNKKENDINTKERCECCSDNDMVVITKQLLLDEIRSGSFVLKSISAKGWFGLW